MCCESQAETEDGEINTSTAKSGPVSQCLVHRINGDADPGDFVIRTRGALWCSRPNPVLVATSLAALALACIIALTPLGRAFSFVAVPALPLLTIGGIVLAYLCLAEAVKRRALREPADRPQIR